MRVRYMQLLKSASNVSLSTLADILRGCFKA